MLHLCLLILVVGAPAVLAQSDPAQLEDQAADVVIDGRAVLRVRGIKGYGAELRASLISERLVRLASDPYFNPASITVVGSVPHEMLRLYSNLHRNIQDLFNEYGVQIMTPAYRADKEAPVVVPKENWHTAPADQFSEGEEETEDREPSDAVATA